MASVYDERKAHRNKSYNKPHLEKWCPQCYNSHEANKYTYVIQMPDKNTYEVRTRRVLRLDDAGNPVELPEAKVADVAPVSDEIPAWAARAASKAKTK